MLQVEHLSYGYGARQVLKDINFTLDYGLSVSLLGKNGVGKSTLFKSLLGILKPQSGEVRINGRPIQQNSRQELARLISYIPQKQQSIFHFTVFEMVLMGTASFLKNWQQPGKQQQQQAQAALEQLHIAHLRDVSFSEISGGEQQLAIIARSIAQQSRIIIMDEPCASLDFGNQIMVLEMIRWLAGSGYLVIQSTHDPNHALQYSDHVLILQEGQLSSQGPPEEVLTSQSLETLYQVPVGIHEFGDQGQKVCVAQKKEEHYVGHL